MNRCARRSFLVLPFLFALMIVVSGTGYGGEPDKRANAATGEASPAKITNSVGMKLVLIPAGEFMMASDRMSYSGGRNEQPQHKVRITKPFYLGVYEVTQAEYEKVMGKNPSFFCETGRLFSKVSGMDTSRFPVEGVSSGIPTGNFNEFRYWDVLGFCNVLSKKEGLPPYYAFGAKAVGKGGAQMMATGVVVRGGNGYRLPTGAEWEYACRAGTTTKYCFGDNAAKLGEYAWYRQNSDKRTHPVGGKKPNAWGLYDMHGNVSERCWDWYQKGYYEDMPTDDSGPAYLSARWCGGSYDDDLVRFGCACRSATGYGTSSRGFSTDGFRVARTPEAAEERATSSNKAVGKVETPAPDAKEEAGPPLAVAPFPADQAKKHQQAWAEHLGVSVEITNSIGMKLALIPPGEFLMGSPDSDAHADDDEKPQHKVRITKPFYLGVYEVTQEQYEKVMGKNSSFFGETRVSGTDTSRFAADMGTWNNAVEFCNRLSAKEGNTYRLPTEAKWEYACRAGTTTRYSFGDDVAKLGEYARWLTYSERRNADTHMLHPVGERKPNAWGLYDMHGSVWEWCEDRYGKGYYEHSPTDDPQGPASSEYRVVRSGTFDRQNPDLLRCALRNFGLPGLSLHGFRVARTLTP